MKRMIWILVPMIVLLALILTGCDRTKAPEENDDVDGGVRHDNSVDAPKTIESTEITSFECTFSTTAMSAEDTVLAGNKYRLTAKLENGVVEGSYWTRSDGEEQGFRTDSSFMEHLQHIVAEYDLAQHNGHSYRVSGLPDHYGAALSVSYASSESIYANNNQSCFLSFGAMEALEELFRRQIEDGPVLLDLTVETEVVMEEADGHFLTVQYPILTMGYLDWMGRYVGSEDHVALGDALDAYNNQIRGDQKAALVHTLHYAADHLGEDAPMYLDSFADVFITRNDDRVVAFYETLVQQIGLLPELHYRRGFNYDAKTGALLGFDDVFTDTDGLAALLAEAFGEINKDLYPRVQLEGEIRKSITAEDGVVCFALGNGGVHFFAQQNPLGGDVGILEVMLSYADHPELVREEYRASPESWMLELDYDRTYRLPDGTALQMNWRMGEEDVEWSLMINDQVYTELFYGYAPTVHLIQKGDKGFIYLRVPIGDISYQTYIYEVPPSGLRKIGEVAAAMDEAMNIHPERMRMVMADAVLSGSVLLQPIGLYCAEENGMPILASDVYGLMGMDWILTRDVEATLADAEDTAFEGGPLPLKAGMVLTPFRTDRASYVDFINEEGTICRFTIDGFTDEMSLNGFGTPGELFEPVYES